MGRQIHESDWKLFRELRSHALDRFCERVLADVARIATDTASNGHDRYLAVFKLIQERDEELAAAFNESRRSTALIQLAHIRSLDLLTGPEIARFSPDTRSALEAFQETRRA